MALKNSKFYNILVLISCFFPPMPKFTSSSFFFGGGVSGGSAFDVFVVLRYINKMISINCF